MPRSPPSESSANYPCYLVLQSGCGLGQPNDADVLFNDDVRPERPRQSLKSFENAFPKRRGRRARNAAIREPISVIQLDGVQANLSELIPLVSADSDNAFVPDVLG